MKEKIHLGLIGMAFPDLYMGEELCGKKTREMARFLSSKGYRVSVACEAALSPEEVRRYAPKLSEEEIDCIIVAVTTFIGDYYMTALHDAVGNKPVFLWMIEREPQCIPLVAGPLCSATLKNLGCHYDVTCADIGDEYSTEKLYRFAVACRAVNRLKTMRIGFSGGKAMHMFSQGCDELMLYRKTGITVVNFPLEEFYAAFREASKEQATELWNGLTNSVGCVNCEFDAGVESCRYYFAAKAMIEKYHLDAISLNCFPYLKARICLPIALLNDEGIPAGCEGSILDTVLMHIAFGLSHCATVNADILRMFPESNDITFSHCGAGAMSLCKRLQDVTFAESIETHSGVSVLYETYLPGTVTFANLVSAPEGMRLSTMEGTWIQDHSAYEGNPLCLHFNEDVRKIYDRLCAFGAGVHYIGISGSWADVYERIARMINIPFEKLC